LAVWADALTSDDGKLAILAKNQSVCYKKKCCGEKEKNAGGGAGRSVGRKSSADKICTGWRFAGMKHRTRKENTTSHVSSEERKGPRHVKALRNGAQ